MFLPIGTGYSRATEYVDCNNNSNPWFHPERILTDDGEYANIAVQGSTSNTLVVRHFDFDLPTGCIINGIKVSIERKDTEPGEYQIIDYSIKLCEDCTLKGNNKSTNSIWTTSDVVSEYGGESDKWGVELTESIVEDDSFGWAIQISDNASKDYPTAYIDYMNMEVFYAEAPINAIFGIEF